LEFLEKHFREWGITSLAVPPLGCGQGGLEWRVVGPTLYRHLSHLEIPVELYAPFGTRPFELTPEFLGAEAKETIAEPSPWMEPTRIPPAWLTLVEILQRIVSEPYHWPVGRTTLQKIAYFATEAGLPTGLKFSKGSYGPFSADLKPMLTKLVNNGLIEEHPLGKMLAVNPGPTFADARKAFDSDISQWQDLIENVADLFMRIRTQQAEIAASVLFTARTLRKADVETLTEYDVFQGVMAWKVRRNPPLKPEEVAQTMRSLNILRWVNLQPSQQLPVPTEAW